MKRALGATAARLNSLGWKALLVFAIDILMLFLIGFVMTAYSQPLKAWLTHGGNLVVANAATEEQELLTYFVGIAGMKTTIFVLIAILLLEGVSLLVIWIYLQGKLFTFLAKEPAAWWKNFSSATILWGILWGAISVLSRLTGMINSLSMRIDPQQVVFNWDAIFIPARYAIMWLWLWQSLRLLRGKKMTIRSGTASLWQEWRWHAQAGLFAVFAGIIIHLALQFVHKILLFSPLISVGEYPLLWLITAAVLVFPSLLYLRLFILEVTRENS